MVKTYMRFPLPLLITNDWIFDLMVDTTNKVFKVESGSLYCILRSGRRGTGEDCVNSRASPQYVKFLWRMVGGKRGGIPGPFNK